MFFLFYPGQGRETFNYVQLIGFVLLMFGTLVFNEILVLPILDLNRYTREALREKAEGEKTKLAKGALMDHHQSYGTLEKN